MTKQLINPAQVNVNTTQEVIAIPCADCAYAVVEVIPENPAHTTYRAEVVWQITPMSPWRSFTTAVTLSQASPNSGLLGTVGVMRLGVRITTVQGAAGYANVYASGETINQPLGRIG